MLSSLDDHLSVVSAFDGVMVGVTGMKSPTATVMDSGSEMPVGSTGVTVTVQEAVLLFEVLTVIVVVPTLLPETFPEETVAMVLSLESHVSVVEALEGVIVGVKVIVLPT